MQKVPHEAALWLSILGMAGSWGIRIAMEATDDGASNNGAGQVFAPPQTRDHLAVLLR